MNTRIISKYFNKETTEMEDSLSEFQEPKRSLKIRDTKRTCVKKNKKKVKVQKDIRTALQSNSSNLIDYTKDFNAVCKLSGIDVDSEQLQLAVALSKSLHEIKDGVHEHDANNLEHQQTFRTMTPQEQSSNIKNTLLEYGFKVPDIRIASSTKRFKRRMKTCKLLKISNQERQQVIADKFAQLLFNYGNYNLESSDNEQKCSAKEKPYLYNICTHMTYDHLRNDDIFYVKTLFDKTNIRIGNLLKKWSEIPGRELSPPRKPLSCIPSTGLQYSQYELDAILSGKLVSIPREKVCNESEPKLSQEESAIDFKVGPLSQTRCPSPDMFEDDSSIINHSKPLNETSELNISHNHNNIKEGKEMSSLVYSQNNLDNCSRTINCDYMDLTSCVNLNNDLMEIKTKHIDNVIMSQKNNHSVTIRRKSDDFMELTQCMRPVATQIVSLVEEDVNSVDCGDVKGDKISDDYNIDLTQSSDSNESFLPDVFFGGCVKDINNSISSTDHVGSEINSEELFCSIVNDDTASISKESNGTHIFEDYYHHHSDERSNHSTVSNESSKSICSNKLSNVDLTLHQETNEIYQSNSESLPIHQYDKACNTVDNISIRDLVKCPSNKSLKNTFNIDIVDNIKILESTPNLPLHESSELIFEISDEEFDYSMHKSKHYNDIEKSFNSGLNNESNMGILGTSFIYNPNDEIILNEIDRNSDSIIIPNESMSDSDLPEVEIKGVKCPKKSPKQSSRTLGSPTVLKSKISVVTPKNNGYTIKTTNVTPMLDYQSLDTPERNRELDKYGLKPFKRKRAIQLLEHIYYQTHPIIEDIDQLDNISSDINKRFKHDLNADIATGSQTVSDTQKCNLDRDTYEVPDRDVNELSNRDIYEVTNEVPGCKEIQCSPDDWFFHKREKSKMHFCQVPLHIAFHNYVGCRRGLREAILRYEPVNIDVIHKQLATYGYKYNPKELLKFLDKKCITVKTMDNNTRNMKNNIKSHS